MDLRSLTLQRLDAFLRQLKEIDGGVYAYSDSRDALEGIRFHFESLLSRIERFDEHTDPAVVRQKCTLALRNLARYTPFLGFILRSMNVRNAFEVARPLKRIAAQILEPGVAGDKQQTRLVLSSEWSYSPFTYVEVPVLPGFVFLGLPAFESSNPLILPLAGHEIGHSLWAAKSCEALFVPQVARAVADAAAKNEAEYRTVFRIKPSQVISAQTLHQDMFLRQLWRPAAAWAGRQAQEVFCDLVGLHIFHESYLRAFAYLLAPSLSPRRSPTYPGVRRRVEFLQDAAPAFGITLAESYLDLFEDPPTTGFRADEAFLLKLADEALDSVIGEVRREVDKSMTNAALDAPTAAETARVRARFELAVPPEGARTLPDLVNAGWDCALDDSLWASQPHLHKSRPAILKDLILKAIEVYDIEQTLAGAGL